MKSSTGVGLVSVLITASVLAYSPLQPVPISTCVAGDIRARMEARVPDAMKDVYFDARKIRFGIGAGAVGGWESLGEAAVIGNGQWVDTGQLLRRSDLDKTELGVIGTLTDELGIDGDPRLLFQLSTQLSQFGICLYKYFRHRGKCSRCRGFLLVEHATPMDAVFGDGCGYNAVPYDE